jgi:thiol-disulfide isomerase/thioredoxin
MKKEGAVSDTINKLEILTVDGSAMESAKRGFEQWVVQLKRSGLGDEQKSGRHADSLRAFIAQHPGSKASAYLLGEAHDLRYVPAKTLLQMIDSSLSGTYEYKTAVQLVDRIYKEDRIAAGVPFHDVALYDTSGRTIDSRQLRGKYVLVEFWASWCGPCMAAIPSLRSLYEKNKGKNFVILGVSWDYNKDSWKKAIIRTGMPWPQVIDRDEHNGKLGEYYAFDHIPTNILLDPSGRILGNELSLEEIEKLLPPADGHASSSR